MPWSCFACNARGGAACPGHAVAPAGSEGHCCASGSVKWFCDKLDCRGHSAPGPFIAGPGPLASFSASQKCADDPSGMWYCRARGCQGHLRRGQTCRDSDCRDDATRDRDADGPKFFCRWTGCNGHSEPDHFHEVADVRAAEAARGAPASHAAAINRTTTLAPPTRLNVVFKYFNYVFLDNFRAVTSHDEYVSDERLWSESAGDGEPRTNWLESLIYSVLRTGPGPRRGYRGSRVKPVTSADEFRTLWGSRMTSSSTAGMPAGDGPEHVTVFPGSDSAPIAKHFVHAFVVSAGGTAVDVERVRVIEIRGESDWTETDGSGGSARSAGGNYYTLLPDTTYYFIALPFRLSEDAITDIAVLIEFSLRASGDDLNMFDLFKVNTTPRIMVGQHGAARLNEQDWTLPVVNPFHIALRMAKLAMNRFDYLMVTEPQRGDHGLSDSELKRRYGAMYTELVGHLAQMSSDYADSIDLSRVGNDCKRYSLYHRRAAGGLLIALAYMLNSRAILELEYLTQIRPEDMDAGGGWWVLMLGECSRVLTRHSAGIEVFRLRQEGAATGDFVSPMSKWFRINIEPETARLAGPGLPTEQPTGADSIVGYVGNAGEVVTSMYEAWSFTEVLRRGLVPSPQSDSSFSSRLSDAATKLQDSWRSDGLFRTRVAANATHLTRFVSLGTAAYKLCTGTMDYSSFASALGTTADIWSSRAGQQAAVVARCMFLKTVLAAVETGRSGLASRDAALVGDTSVAVGAGMVAAASGFTVAWCVVAGTAPAGPWGWCIGAVALTGGLIVTLTTDDDIEIYGRYSYYSTDRLVDWPTSLLGDAPYTYMREDTSRWGEETAWGFKANLTGLLCYIYKVHSVALDARSDGRHDKATIEMHASPSPTTLRVKMYFRASGATGAMAAAVGSGDFKVLEFEIDRLVGRSPHVRLVQNDLRTQSQRATIASDSSKYEISLSVELVSTERDNWVLYDTYVQVKPFGTNEFVTPALGWWSSGGRTELP